MIPEYARKTWQIIAAGTTQEDRTTVYQNGFDLFHQAVFMAGQHVAGHTSIKWDHVKVFHRDGLYAVVLHGGNATTQDIPLALHQPNDPGETRVGASEEGIARAYCQSINRDPDKLWILSKFAGGPARPYHPNDVGPMGGSAVVPYWQIALRVLEDTLTLTKHVETLGRLRRQEGTG